MESEKVEKVVPEVEELPKAIVRRVVKDKLSHCSTDGDLNVHKDALLAFSESARIFIHYLSATANDICKESKRQTINANDVLKALEEIEFPEFVGPLKASLDEFKQKNVGKKAGASETGKKAAASDMGKKAGASETGKNTGESETKEVKKKRKVEEPSKKIGGKSKQKKED
ncbi:hypothetical protein P3X46_009853 [Hevea brasiliensis]|uniref:Transcription factor CBF/NF-Y/archaeal histone domain-containing protein n=1 Tax=Hevea brasiliensis TaxID=3981 RepID=A0ABQ9MG10_HEVBR|nr:DNA polymerase II subunit B4 [Hevea brasiliensis]KAJ9177925.1 hypothetical protein P3X46_009853 [Hevea brasiliensis]